jgi:hypothetical protein
MKTYRAILAAILLIGLSALTQANESPVTFVRSGQKATLPVGQGDEKNRVVLLTASGQRWGEPVAVKSGVAEIVAPEARVPLVFRLATVNDAGARVIPGEVVVYPDRWLPWDSDKKLSKYKEMRFAAVSVPDWFEAWLEAIGFPIEKFSSRESFRNRGWQTLGKPSVLIVGRKAASRGAAEVGRLAIEYQTNVFVLEADWLDKADLPASGIEITPKQARGALADLQVQEWPSSPTFHRQALPWPYIANRLTWIDGAKYPLIEEIYSRQKDAAASRIVFSYLPWQEQLGRCEMADELLLRVLAETAKGASDRRPLDGQWRLLYPDREKVKSDKRPVLAAALKSAEESADHRLAAAATSEPRKNCGYVLDLRGDARLPDEVFGDSGIVKSLEERIGKDTPLLILGDDPKLDTWRWLELDRERRKSPRPGVIWCPDDSLPASLESQLRVMDVFTQWHILLEDTFREKSNENFENEL